MAESFVNLNCANCGAKLEVYDDMERFACGYCGTEMVVQRRGGTVALKAVTEAIKKVQIGTDKTAAELALIRLRQELATLEDEATKLVPVTPIDTPAGCIVTPLILGLVVAAAASPMLGIIIMLSGIAICVVSSNNNPKPEDCERWKATKAALDGEIEKVKRDIAQQIEIISSWGGSRRT